MWWCLEIVALKCHGGWDSTGRGPYVCQGAAFGTGLCRPELFTRRPWPEWGCLDACSRWPCMPHSELNAFLQSHQWFRALGSRTGLDGCLGKPLSIMWEEKSTSRNVVQYSISVADISVQTQTTFATSIHPIWLQKGPVVIKDLHVISTE